jgi:spore coat polysaccharide biosynthesis protein SpsF
MDQKRVVLIMQARMGSIRLPGKSLMDLAGAPLVGRMLERVKKCKSIDDIVLAIPDTIENKPLADLGYEYNVSVFAGSEINLVDRYYQAALNNGADVVVRLPADNATPEPDEIDKIINYHLGLDAPGFTSNISNIKNSGYPDGIGAEVFNFSLLEEIHSMNLTKEKQEHLHLNFFDYDLGKSVDENWCPVHTLKCPVEFRRPDIILDVNTESQYKFIKKLYEDLYPQNPNFGILDIINWYDDASKTKH